MKQIVDVVCNTAIIITAMVAASYVVTSIANLIRIVFAQKKGVDKIDG